MLPLCMHGESIGASVLPPFQLSATDDLAVLFPLSRIWSALSGFSCTQKSADVQKVTKNWACQLRTICESIIGRLH